MLTIKLSGYIGDLESILEKCKEHIIMIQEHKQLQQEMEKWKSCAGIRGWHGVWEQAAITEKNEEGQ